MGNSVVASYVATSIIFLGTGILLISIAAVWQKELMSQPTMESVARYLLLKKAPLSGKLHLQPFQNVRTWVLWLTDSSAWFYSCYRKWCYGCCRFPTLFTYFRSTDFTNMAQGLQLVGDGVRTLHIGVGIDGMDYNP